VMIQPQTNSRQVLVVDDDEHFALALAEMLTFMGFEPTVCTTARNALNLTKVCDFQLIFTDIRMPEVGGLEFFRFISLVNARLAQRVVFVSGNLADPEIHRLVTETGNACVEKPVSFESLETIIQKALVRNQPAVKSPPTPLEVEPVASEGSQFAAAPAESRTVKEAPDEQIIAALEKRWQAVSCKSNSGGLSQLLADQAVITDHRGRSWAKLDFLWESEFGLAPETSLFEESLDVRIHGDTAVVTGILSANEDGIKQARPGHYRFTRTWVRKEGQWQCLASHVSVVQAGN
jgi:CheY-like chemotaxis protein